MRLGGGRRVAVLAAALAVTAGCSASTSGSGRPSPAPTTASASASGPSGSAAPSGPSGGAATSGGSATSGGTAACPASYLPPRPDRPRVSLQFSVAPDLTTVTGTEHVSFTPDAPITELVFRLTANTAPSYAAGNSVRVTAASGDHGAGPASYTQDGAAAGSQGGLLHLRYPGTIPAGTMLSADLSFVLTLGADTLDRFGHADAAGGRYAWFGSGEPLLAWQPGYGWHTEPMIDFTAESATSPAMSTDLTVVAPAADTVIMSGDPPSGADAGAGTRRWHATLEAARDVSVAVGPFAVSDTRVGAVALRVAAFSASLRDALVPEFTRAITELARRFGPYPFPSLSVARIPGGGGGIEYPSSILMLDDSRVVAVHETAHQWFYAMVGDSQAQHAWLDEAFASYAEQLVDGTAPSPGALNAPGVVDTPTYAYGQNEASYYFVTYDKGVAALHAARQAAGPDRFDAAIRCYVNAEAWRIATPPDLAAALKNLPEAVSVLEKAGALQ